MSADALVDHMALGESIAAVPLGPAGAVLRDQPGDGPLVQHIRRGALQWMESYLTLNGTLIGRLLLQSIPVMFNMYKV